MFDRRRFKAALAIKGMTMRELAEKLDIAESTLHRKIDADGNFTRKEINKIIKILGIDDPADIFFAEKLA